MLHKCNKMKLQQERLQSTASTAKESMEFRHSLFRNHTARLQTLAFKTSGTTSINGAQPSGFQDGCLILKKTVRLPEMMDIMLALISNLKQDFLKSAIYVF